MAVKSLLFLNRAAPYGHGRAAEMLEAALVAAAFGQEVRLAFLDDGVFQLVAGQQGEAVGQKSLAGLIALIDEHDIDTVLVEAESLRERGLTADDLLVEAEILPRAALTLALAAADLVISA
ncbi:intracellular sulfur oxidation protein DsrF [mine drainage metagenome]|uniref:Intracellular sulfur oxidation protein DsrF n=1 Tax=mine drainage metagenome TaxID=410659 RepID=A0A1J5T7Y7_9ZZZZ